MVDPVILMPAAPLLGAVLMLVTGKRLPERAIHVICTGAAFIAFALAAWSVVLAEGGVRSAVLLDWIPLLGVSFGYLLDPLSSVMILVVTGIGSLIHLFSTGYMAGDKGAYRFFGYLNLFVFFMLVLVLADNYALLFAGWEGVGLCSYLLIGFYFERPAAARAGTKAFLVNRAGDWGFLTGMLLLWTTAGSLRFSAVNERLASLPPETHFGLYNLIALLLFLGAAGKSAQFPLYVWLPDAMEGPTPVSALIHAATMVTAGVYLVARSSMLFSLAPITLEMLAYIGAITAVLAAPVALVQNDIKKVLAYSTVSQLGFMFMALGVGAYWVAVFHLFTHAFFKALLFLGAGSVIHALNGEQDLRKMGGLRRALPVTFATMSLAALALAGAPFLSGFYSKEEILTSAFRSARTIYAVGIITAGMTAWYMGRLMKMTFFGSAALAHAHPHEGGWNMKLPLCALALGSAIAGWPVREFEHWIAPLFPRSEGPLLDDRTGYLLMAAAVGIAAVGAFVAWREVRIAGPLAHLLDNKWYLDELYDRLFVRSIGQRGGLSLSRFDGTVVDGAVNVTGRLTRLQGALLGLIDRVIVDGLVRAISMLVRLMSYPARLAQSGSLQTYALVAILSLLTAAGFFLVTS